MVLSSDKWPAINHHIEATETRTEEDIKRREDFLKDISNLFDRIEEKFNELPQNQKELCGNHGIVAEISLKLNIEKKEIVLEKLYKYSNLNIHFFDEISKILLRNFRDFTFIVPALKGYQLAEEIYRHLGNIKVVCIHLKSDTCERLVDSKDLNDINFETILMDTKRHYSDRCNIKETKFGSDISMFYKGKNGEEEVLWMEVNVPLSTQLLETSI